jgi:hypothetical protein
MVGPELLLTQSQMSIEFPGSSSETPSSLVFSGFSGVGWLSQAQKISFVQVRREVSDSTRCATPPEMAHPTSLATTTEL